MARVPDDPVTGALEHPVERHGQLDDPQRAPEVAARMGDGVDDAGAEVGAQLPELVV